MISCRTFTACGLSNEEWRPLVGMLCFGNQATIWVKSQFLHSRQGFTLLTSVEEVPDHYNKANKYYWFVRD